MRTILMVLGVVLTLVGLLFALQGSGLFPYPASSVMIAQRPWLWRGLGIAAVGLILLALGRRRPL